MKRTRSLGQHLLTEEGFFRIMVNAARITKRDVVFELGAGDGRLTELLCQKAGRTVAFEIDPELYEAAEARLSRHRNLVLVLGDGFRHRCPFDILVSNPPYSQSRRLVEWLVRRNFRRAVITLQREFAEKLLAEPGSKGYGVVTVLAQSRFRVRALHQLGPRAFTPRPKVASTILLLEPITKRPIGGEVVSWLKILFSFRGRRLSAALKSLATSMGRTPRSLFAEFNPTLTRKRIEEMSVAQVFEVAERLTRLFGERKA